jgi:glycosyltransferase involved in cell wall biosynthesis
MKKVLLVAFHYPPIGSSSGVLRTLKFSKYLPEYGWIPHVLTVKEYLYPVKDYGLVNDIPAEAVVHRTVALDAMRHFGVNGRYPGVLAIPDRFISWFPFGTIRGLRVIKTTEISAIFSTSPHPTAHLIAGALKSLTGVPWVADFRDPWVEELPDRMASRSLRSRIDSVLEKRVIRHADRVTVTTPNLREAFRARYPWMPPDKIRTIYNGYDEEDFRGLEKGDAPTKRFEIVHAGLVSKEYRDPGPLLQAASRLVGAGSLRSEDLLITFLGGGAYVRSKDFAEQVHDLGLEKSVEVVERVGYQAALERLQRAAVLLLLQASEDTKSLIPAKAFEYLRIGRPILAMTYDGATSDLLRGMELCYVASPGDQSALQQTFVTLYRLWQTSGNRVGVSRPVSRYERRSLTAELAGLLNGLEETAGLRRIDPR